MACRTLCWHRHAIYRVPLFRVVIRIIVAAIARKTIKRKVGLSEVRWLARRQALTIDQVGMPGGIPVAPGLARMRGCGGAFLASLPPYRR